MRLGRIVMLASLGAATIVACRTPTQITLALSTDVACSPDGPPQLNGTSVYAGSSENVASREVTATRACATRSALNWVGDIAIVPSGDGDGVAVQVVAGVDRPVEQCSTADGYAGCIVARRVLKYIPHRQLQLPVILRRSCVGEPCSEDSTCIDGSCVDAKVTLERCFDDVCDDQSLTSGAGGNASTTSTTSGTGGAGGMSGAGGSSSTGTSSSSSSAGGCQQTQCMGYCCDLPSLPLCGNVPGECCQPQMGGLCYQAM